MVGLLLKLRHCWEASVMVARKRQVLHRKTVTIPAEPASKDQLPPVLQGFGAVPPLVADIDLSMDDRLLYVACWNGRDAAVRRHRPEEAEAYRLRPHRQGVWRRSADG